MQCFERLVHVLLQNGIVFILGSNFEVLETEKKKKIIQTHFI